MQLESNSKSVIDHSPASYIAKWLKEFIEETIAGGIDPGWLNLAYRHGFDLGSDELVSLISNPEQLELGTLLESTDNDQQYLEKLLGEYYARLHKISGFLASVLLMRAQWKHGMSEWYDHRQHLMCPEGQFDDFWTMSADNVMRFLPLDGRLLDFCSGDGFYAYFFFRRRASQIKCVELDDTAFLHAKHFHSDDRIEYIHMDILEYEPEEECYDSVVLRGAVEHFTEEQQQVLFHKALRALRPGGWFCGDTVANTKPGREKMLPSHINEWSNEDEMRSALQCVFSEINTFTLASRNRTTLFWQCRKPSE